MFTYFRRERHNMPSNLGDLQPVEITKDDCSLFRSVSRMIFQDEKYWFLLKVGSIAAGIANEELLIEKASYRFNAFTLRWMYAYYPSAVSVLCILLSHLTYYFPSSNIQRVTFW